LYVVTVKVLQSNKYSACVCVCVCVYVCVCVCVCACACVCVHLPPGPVPPLCSRVPPRPPRPHDPLDCAYAAAWQRRGHPIPTCVCLLQWCYSGAVVLKWCHSGVTVVSQWCHRGVPVVSQRQYLRVHTVAAAFQEVPHEIAREPGEICRKHVVRLF
jgi:hypothetical protein